MRGEQNRTQIIVIVLLAGLLAHSPGSHADECMEYNNSQGVTGSFVTSDEPIDFDCESNHAFLIQADDSLVILDLQYPETPNHISSLYLGGTPTSIEVQNGYAAVGMGDAGLIVVEVSNPNSPQITGSIPSLGNVEDVCSYAAFVCCIGDSFYIVDVSAPSSPTEISSLDIVGEEVKVSEGRAYIREFGTCTVVSLDDPHAPNIIGSGSIHCFPTPGSFSVRDSTVYSVGWMAGTYICRGALEIYDFSDPSSSSSISRIEWEALGAEGNFPDEPQVAGNIVYVSGGAESCYGEPSLPGVIVIDVSDISTPSFIGGVPTNPMGYGKMKGLLHGNYFNVISEGYGFQSLLKQCGSSTTHRVRPDGLGDFATIQDAIDAAHTGDIIELANGIYSGTGNRDLDFVGKDLILQSESMDPTSCVVDCEGSSTEPHRGISITSGETHLCSIRGITIRNGFSDIGGGVYCSASALELVSCIVESCEADSGGGVYVESADILLTDCTVRENLGIGGAGVFALRSGVQLTDCLIELNDGLEGEISSGGGLKVSGTGSVSITECEFSLNTASYGGGLYLEDHAAPQLNSTRIVGNRGQLAGGGAYCAVFASPQFIGCLFAENESDSGGAILSSLSTVSIDGCTICYNSAFGGGSGVYSTNNSLISCTASIIAFAPTGSAVQCDGGSVQLSCTDIFGNQDGNWTGCIAGQLGIAGNFEGNPRFCDPWSSDYSISANSACHPDSTPCGVRAGAYAVGCGPLPLVVDPAGNGDFSTIQSAVNAVADGDTIRLAPGVFQGTGNTDVSVAGKSVAIIAEAVDPVSTVIDCNGSEVNPHRGFTVGPGIESQLHIQGLSVMNGWAESGGAVSCLGGSVISMESCSIVDNYGTVGGAVFVDTSSTATITKSILARNSSQQLSSAVYLLNSTLHLSESTLVSNWCDAELSGAIACLQGEVSASYCLISHNGAGEAVFSSLASIDFDCTNIYGNGAGDWTGSIADQLGFDGNTSLNPIYCDLYDGDYTLASSSPCLPENNDCGELIGSLGEGCSEVGVLESNRDKAMELHANHPNPFNSTSEIVFSLSKPMSVTIQIFSPAGRKVRALVESSWFGPGTHRVSWDGRNDHRAPLPSGVYLYQLIAGGESASRKMVLVN